MSNDRSIPASRPTDLPTFTILVDGNSISNTYKVAAVTVSREVNRLAEARILIFDGDASQENFAASSSETFVPGNEIEVKAGYHGDETTIFKGLIIQHSVRARMDKPSQLEVLCKHPAVKLTVGRKNAYFYEMTDKEVIEELCGNLSLSADVGDTSQTHAEMVQFYSTDWDFILMRAEANGMLVITEDDQIKVAPPDLSGSPVASLTFGGNVLEFEARMDARDQYAAVQSLAWDPANQEMLTLEASDTSPALPGNVDLGQLSGVVGLGSLDLRHAGQLKDQELQSWADAFLLKSQLAKVRGRVKTRGLAEALPGTLVELAGMGDRFNGAAFVSAVRHTINSKNWETDISFGLSPQWFYQEKDDIVDRKANGLLPAINGLQIGLVSQVGEDPDGEDRVQVRIPLIDPAGEGVWARVASLDAGENRGAFFRPEIGDEVVLGFLNDDPRNPIILGMMNSSAKPAPITGSDDNHEKGFVTRDELKLMFNDDLKSITLESPAGKKIIISEDEGSILIEDENGHKIEMLSDGINLESAGDINITASGDVNIEGTNVTCTANAQFKGEGSAGAELSSSATTVIQGSMVQIN